MRLLGQAPRPRAAAQHESGWPSRRAQRSSAARAEATHTRHVVVVGLGLGDKKDSTVNSSGSKIRRISRSRASRPCWGRSRRSTRRRTGRSKNAAQKTKVCMREVSCMISSKSRRHRDFLSCLAPRARLAGGLVRGPVQLLARPAAVLDAHARTALVEAVVGATRARAVAALDSPGLA